MTRGDGPPSRGPKLPQTFRSLDLLRRLNVAAMGLSLAGATAAMFAKILGAPSAFGTAALTTGLPTLLFGVLWAVVLRSRKKVGKSSVRWGWVLSIPLAALNAAFACGLLLSTETSSEPLTRFFLGMIAGATFGAIFWVPSLLATLAFFGLPVWWSQSLAEKGLAGEERGERVLGLASTFLAVFALAGDAWWGETALYPRNGTLDTLGNLFLWVVPLLAVAAGTTSTLLAHARENRRRRFVDEVERGQVEGFRIEQAPEGKVLLRVSSVGSAYRVANFEEEIYAFDEEGGAREEKRAMALPRPDTRGDPRPEG